MMAKHLNSDFKKEGNVRIPLERHSSKAVYLQIRDRIRRLIETGALQAGDKLPSIRSLAESTKVNKLTVIEAYNVLKADGLIAARQGSGYFVNPASNHQLQAQNLQSRNVMLSALKRYFPPSASWTVPNGGTFLWVQLPTVSMSKICRLALERNVFIADGKLFFPGQQGYPALRLNFSVPLDKISQGISVLGELLLGYLTSDEYR